MDVVKIFTNGKNQMVRLPENIVLHVDEMYVFVISDAVVLLPKDQQWRDFMYEIDHSPLIEELINQGPADGISPE